MNRRLALSALAALGLALPVLLASGDGDRNSTTPPVSTSAAANPAFAPGKVRWHPTFEAACAAAAKSGKPVFLFQMLGRLDQELC